MSEDLANGLPPSHAVTQSRTRQQVRPSLVVHLGTDALQCIFEHLDLASFFLTAVTCQALRHISQQRTLLARLLLGRTEPAVFVPARQQLLQHLAIAGNAAACYRLGVAKVYHPALSTMETHNNQALLTSNSSDGNAAASAAAAAIGVTTDGGRTKAVRVEEGKALLRRAMELDTGSIRADAAFELWLLTRRQPDASERCESLLSIASREGHNPARFSMHRPHSNGGEPNDFRVSDDFAAAQDLLVSALLLHPTCLQTTFKCRNPKCGRWGMRKRARQPGLAGPPALSRCEGLHGAHCYTRYCSRFCQLIHWPEHRKECSLPAV